MKRLITLAITLATLLTLTACGTTTTTSNSYADIPACAYEDGSDTEGTGSMCKWDAHTMGNHRGDGILIYRDGRLIDRR